jgi:hypothetical protein
VKRRSDSRLHIVNVDVAPIGAVGNNVTSAEELSKA